MTDSDKSEEIVTIFLGDFIGQFNELSDEMTFKFKDITAEVFELMKKYKLKNVSICMKVQKQ